ncbi:MAG TPA: metal ABC transporter substrate-binding protein [Methylomirabilota bacterium]|nr:metal ABC transporter substrate-binding protein [Methylomirabilota bacterium]
MRRCVVLFLVLLSVLGTAPAGRAADKIRVVATITDLKALTEAVGGDLVEVDTLARGNQNPHDLEVRPSLMVKLRRADLIVMNGLELDQWAEVVIRGSNNPKLVPGAPGRVDASEGILVLDVPKTRVDRSMGDVHPLGNPHYTPDPGMAPAITANIVTGLVRVAPQGRATFERNRQAFLTRLEQAQAAWTAALAPVKGAKVVVDHGIWTYFLTRFGLVQAATIEERPGIPATPTHVAKVIQLIKAERIKAILTVPWGDGKLAARIGEESGAKVVPMAPAVGGVKGPSGYIDTVDYNVKTLAQALK